MPPQERTAVERQKEILGRLGFTFHGIDAGTHQWVWQNCVQSACHQSQKEALASANLCVVATLSRCLEEPNESTADPTLRRVHADFLVRLGEIVKEAKEKIGRPG